jgi:hypothetical protein
MRHLVVLLVIALFASACAAPPEPAAGGLGAPLVAVADALELAVGTADSARHRAERGAAMRDALGLERGMLAKVSAAADELEAVAEQARDEGLRRLTADAAERARAGADAGDHEVEVLGRIVEADALLDRAVSAWSGAVDGPSPEELEAAANALASAPRAPRECGLLWENRARWLRLTAERTRALADPSTPPELLESFRLNPFGEVRRVADAGDRPCWTQHSELVRAADAVAASVAAVAGR